ncbi:DUF2247 family protein [Fictibacillus nanhaiensis]|uniref:DUF2247 family protein n=1 Tax=Fictibacillus nanhaiensis TaxID=742169 RepID=UPI002E1C5D3B|nr:DUF2247 family protein [Fictibacillus nanhaiensis]
MDEHYDYSYIKSLNIKIDVPFVIRGLQLKMITKKFVEDFALSSLENEDQPTIQIVDLAWGVHSEIDALELLISSIEKPDLKAQYNHLPEIYRNEEEFDHEIWKWRYVNLIHAFNHYKSQHELFESIDIIYARFGFPDDMYELIYYHPTKTVSLLTPEEAQQKLESAILHFVNKQKHLFVSNP